jgi:hypothetical protein
MIQFYGESTGEVGRLLDDIVINDTNGSVNNSWPGQVRLLPIQPCAAGDVTELTRKGIDLGANYAQVREPGHGGFAVVETDTVNKRDLYAVDLPDLPAGATIKNVIVKATANVQNGSGGLALLLKAGTTESEGSNQALVSDFKTFGQVWDINPDTGVAWTEADLADLQIGIKAK